MNCPSRRKKVSGGGGVTAREAILNSISDRDKVLVREPAPTIAVQGDLWNLFRARLEALGGQVLSEFDLTDRIVWLEPAASEVIGIAPTAVSIWDVEIGVSVAEFAIAEMGSVMVRSGDSRERLSSLIPPINLILVHRESIFATLSEAIDRIPDRNCALITGPSRTADIEGVLVKGVHGPKEVWIYPYG